MRDNTHYTIAIVKAVFTYFLILCIFLGGLMLYSILNKIELFYLISRFNTQLFYYNNILFFFFLVTVFMGLAKREKDNLI